MASPYWRLNFVPHERWRVQFWTLHMCCVFIGWFSDTGYPPDRPSTPANDRAWSFWRYSRYKFISKTLARVEYVPWLSNKNILEGLGTEDDPIEKTPEMDQALVLECISEADPPPTIRWLFNGLDIELSNRHRLSLDHQEWSQKLFSLEFQSVYDPCTAVKYGENFAIMILQS